MAFTVMLSLQTNLTSPEYGQRLGVAGNIIFQMIVQDANLFLSFIHVYSIFSCCEKVYRVWWHNSPATSSRFGIWGCSFHTKWWLIC